jgi:hypothetical protein
MRKLVALLAVTMIASCGGGGISTPADAIASAPSIHYQGSWQPTHFDSTRTVPPATFTLRALPGQTAISANPVARVEVQLGQAAPVVLTAANSTDAEGRPQYVFDFGQLAEAPNCSGFFPTLQVGITVVDVTGFAYTKKIATCATFGSGMDFGAFSDYGTTSVQFSYSATAPITAFSTRNSPTGYIDTLVSTSQASFNATLPAAEGDTLLLRTNPNLPLPSGTRVRSRIDGGGGAFAESTLVAPVTNVQSAFVGLTCCGPKPAAGGSVDIGLRIRAFVNGIPFPPDATYTYRFQIMDPATGVVIGSQTDTIFGDANFPPLQVKRGHVIEMDVTPNDPRIGVEASVSLGPLGGANAASNEVGTPARFRVFCCSP